MKARIYYAAAKGDRGSSRPGCWLASIIREQTPEGKIIERMGGKQIIFKDLIYVSVDEMIRCAGPNEIMITPHDNSRIVKSYFFPFDLENPYAQGGGGLSEDEKQNVKSYFINHCALPITHQDGEYERNIPVGSMKPLVQTIAEGIYFDEIEVEGDKPPVMIWYDQKIQSYIPDEHPYLQPTMEVVSMQNKPIQLGKSKKKGK
jgi:hypothetical protein